MKNSSIMLIIMIAAFIFPTGSCTSVQADSPQPVEREYLSAPSVSDTPVPPEIGLTAGEKIWLRNHPDIVLGTDESWTPCVIPGKDGTIKGIEVDFIDRINNLTGAHIRLVLGRWDDMLKKAQNREIDGLVAWSYHKERNRFFLFSAPVYSAYQYIYIKKGTDKNLKTMSDLKGLKVGYQQKSIVEERLLHMEDHVVPVAAQNQGELINMLLSNDVDAVMSAANLRITAAERQVFNIDIAFIIPGSQTDIVYSTRNDWPELNSIINKALRHIPYSERMAILKKWAGVSIQTEPLILDEMEIAWLKAHPVVRVVSDPAYAPLEFLGENGEYQGIAIDYLRRIEEKLNIHFEWQKNIPWPQMVNMARQRSIDMISCVMETPERSEYLTFTPPFFDSPIAIFSRPETPYVGNLSILKGKKVIVVEGYAIEGILKKEHPEIMLVSVRDIHDAFQKIESGTASYYIGSLVVTSRYIMQSGNILLKVAGETPYTYSLSIASRNDWPVFAGILKKALDSITPEERNEIYRKWISVSYEHQIDYSIIWETGGIVLFIVIFIFLWNRRLKHEVNRQTAKIKANEFFLNNLIEAIPIPVFYKDMNGRYLGFNKAFEDFTGATKEHTIGKTAFEIISPDLAYKYFEKDRELFISGENQQYQSRIKNVHGDLRDVIFNKAVFRDNTGAIDGLVGSVLDITERRRTTEKIRKSEEKYRTLFEAANDAIFAIQVTDKGFIITDSNSHACKMFGYDNNAFTGMSLADISPLQQPNGRLSKEKADEILETAMTGSPCFFEWTHTRSDGTDFDAEVSLNRVDIGEDTYLQAVVRDISDRKRSETEKKDLEFQLLQSQKMEAIGTLAGGIAHDFNNILSVILGYSDLLMASCTDDDEIRHDIGEIKIAGKRAKDLVMQILTFSRQSEQIMQPVKVQLIVKETLKLLRSSIPTTIDIRQDIDITCRPVLANPTQIHQVVMNLCTNAYYAMRKTGGILSVSLKPADILPHDVIENTDNTSEAYLELEISDTGCGISGEFISKIFEPYFTTKAKSQGTGLGLSIVHGVVKKLSGDIKVYSDIRKGTTFRIYLPVLKDIKEGTEEEHIRELPTGTERILLVDDEARLLSLHQKIMEDLGYKVTAYSNSVLASKTFHEKPDDFDLVITDMTMPKITGADLSKLILALRPDMPIVLCTGYSELIDAEKAETIGIRSFIMKPITRKQLADVVRYVLDKTKKSQRNRTRFEGDDVNGDHSDHR